MAGPEQRESLSTLFHRKPGRSKLCAQWSVSEAELKDFRLRLETEAAIDPGYGSELTDSQGVVQALEMKTNYVARQETSLRKRAQETADSPA